MRHVIISTAFPHRQDHLVGPTAWCGRLKAERWLTIELGSRR